MKQQGPLTMNYKKATYVAPSPPAIARSSIFLDPKPSVVHVISTYMCSMFWSIIFSCHGLHKGLSIFIKHLVDMSICNLLMVDSHVVATSNPTGQFKLHLDWMKNCIIRSTIADHAYFRFKLQNWI